MASNLLTILVILILVYCIPKSCKQEAVRDITRSIYKLLRNVSILARVVLNAVVALVNSIFKQLPLLLLACRFDDAFVLLFSPSHVPPLRDARQSVASHVEGPLPEEHQEDEEARKAAVSGMQKMERHPLHEDYEDTTVDFLESWSGSEYLYFPAQPNAAVAAMGTVRAPGHGFSILHLGVPNSDSVAQGSIGSCWLVATIAAVSQRGNAIQRRFRHAHRRLPPGACPVALYDKSGRERTLPLDTRLYYRRNLHSLRLQGSRSNDNGTEELWVPMLEKAMARLYNNSYENINGGMPATALFALTGASIESFHIDDSNDGAVFDVVGRSNRDLVVAGAFGSPFTLLVGVVLAPLQLPFACLGIPTYGAIDVINCLCPLSQRRCCAEGGQSCCFKAFHVLALLKSIFVDVLNLLASLILAPLHILMCGKLSSVIPYYNGIFPSHAYTVLSSVEVKKSCCCFGCGSTRLMRLRNPHGKRSREWTGAWADNSCAWLCVEDKERRRVGYAWSDDHYLSRRCHCLEWGIGLVCFPCCCYNHSASGRTEQDDGSFFMSEADFLSVFSTLDVCHAREGWGRSILHATVFGTSAYFHVSVDRVDAGTRTRRCEEMLGPADQPAQGVEASFAIADPYGTARVRMTVYDDRRIGDCPQPIASTNPDNSRDSFTWGSGGSVRVAGTDVAVLSPGRRYTVFVQFDEQSLFFRSRILQREISLLVSSSAPSQLKLSVADIGTSKFPWAPRGPTPYGECYTCRRALPPDFASWLGRRYHPECVPTIKPCGRRTVVPAGPNLAGVRDGLASPTATSAVDTILVAVLALFGCDGAARHPAAVAPADIRVTVQE